MGRFQSEADVAFREWFRDADAVMLQQSIHGLAIRVTCFSSYNNWLFSDGYILRIDH